MDAVNKNITDRVGGEGREAVPQGFATTVEAAGFLRLTRQAVSQMVLAGKIPAVRFGRALRIPWDWLYEQKQRAREEAPVPFPRKRGFHTQRNGTPYGS